jgi:hypothetical protein
VTKKIALIGSAPSSIRLGPYTQEDWQVWACSPGAYPHLSPTRVNAWFELHRWEPPWGPSGPKDWFTKDYIAWMAGLKCPVFMIEPVPEIPTSCVYPKDEMLEKFGPWFFTSTLSWMFALAITEGATEIALFGVDMSHESEWAFQRSGCHYFIAIARAMGITVTTPPESDLMRPPPLYGFREVDPMHVKLLCREKELTERITHVQNELQKLNNEFHFLQGALNDNTYHLKTWVADKKALELAYTNPIIELSATAKIETTLTPPNAKPDLPRIIDSGVTPASKARRSRKGSNGHRAAAE